MNTFQPTLRTKYFAKELIYLNTVDSTNNYLFHEFKGPFTEGLVVVAHDQSAGRGRMGRSWFSSPGKSLLYSILLMPNAGSDNIPQITQVCALSITKVLEAAYGLKPAIKWPNDIYLGDKKLGGILSEARFHNDILPVKGKSQEYPLVVIGVGLNINETIDEMPLEIRNTATSLLIETGGEKDREDLFARLLYEFEILYEEWKKGLFTDHIEEIGIRFYLKGKKVKAEQGKDRFLEGEVVGINHQGFLLIRDSEGNMNAILSGDVTLCS